MPELYRVEHDRYIANCVGTGVRKIIGIGRAVSGAPQEQHDLSRALVSWRVRADGRRYFTGMIHDISDRRHVEEALRESEH